MSHIDVGGITQGSWSYYINIVSSIKLNLGEVRRNLVHVLDYTQSAARSSLMESDKNNLLAAHES